MSNRRRQRGRTGSGRSSGGVHQAPFSQPRYFQPAVKIISDDEVEAIHAAALEILRDVGVKVLADEARRYFATAGFDSGDEQIVRFDPDGLESLIASAPSTFTLHARNPEKNVEMGGCNVSFCSVGGPAWMMDLDGGRRDGTFADQCNFLKLVQSLDVLHQEGGGGFEALDLPASSRHLDLYLAQCRLLDKNWVPWGIGTDQAMDAIRMAAILFGLAPEQLVDKPVFTNIVNTNTPLQLDIPMAEGLIAMAQYGQCSVITPFTLAGAMAPVTLAGALALQHAEAMAGIALTQIVRAGVPVMYGGFTSNVDMKTGSPAFGTPEYVQAAQASGQLARRLGVPFRSSNVTSANWTDAQSSYESAMSVWGAVSGQANMIKHAAGWLHGGLTASFEKLIIDSELLQMVAATLKPFEVNRETLALDAIREVGPAGHFFGSSHTLARFETAFYQPLVSNWDNFENWQERGSVTTEKQANRIWKQLLADYQAPPLDPSIEEALDDYVARRKRDISTLR